MTVYRLPEKERVPGPTLKDRRKRAGITGVGLAVAMGTTRARVSQIEATVSVTGPTAERYMFALDGLVAERITGEGRNA